MNMTFKHDPRFLGQMRKCEFPVVRQLAAFWDGNEKRSAQKFELSDLRISKIAYCDRQIEFTK